MKSRVPSAAVGQPRDLVSWERVYENPFISLRLDVYHDPARALERHALVLEVADWVNIVALDDQDRVALVRQFRFGTRLTSLEIPGGAVDPGESAYQAAARELLEETGLSAERWEQVGVVDPNPAIQANRCTTFLARGLRQEGEHDATEIDEVSFLPFDRVLQMIREGSIRHALVVAAVHFVRDALDRR